MNFDFFGKRNRTNDESEKKELSFDNFLLNKDTGNPTQSGPVTVFHPKSFKDVEAIIQVLKEKRQAIVYMQELSQSTGCKVIDILSGAVFALDGGMYEMENNTFFLSPFAITQR